MDTELLLEIGAGFAVVALFANQLFAFVLKWREKPGDLVPPNWVEVCQKVEQLHAWHNVRNADGVPVWYMPSSLEKAIIQLAVAIDKQSDILRQVAQMSSDTAKMVKWVVEDKK